ncbi:bridge-like lipid transfer protein family member 1 isoform X1 [Tachypleus tridentatus]|uniref:bridge-like lipid transfer protein family member 1 isoform X1 n=2 Tax=Tachypleus tridentatus TaxID=6853 RepID=UPI003FD02A02
MDSYSSLMELSITSQAPPSPWNGTFPPLENLAMDSDFVWLLCALFMSISWVVYVTYYNSRVIGFIITKMLNRFVKKGYVKIGSFSISVLSGKIMFRMLLL